MAWSLKAAEINLSSFQRNKLGTLQTLDINPLKLSFIVTQNFCGFTTLIFVNLVKS